MKTLNEDEFKALEFAYGQGYSDALDNRDSFGAVIANWFGLHSVEEEQDEPRTDQ